jgi:prepilin-type N-terminal cleavage/methylation domain-containing protein
MKATAKGLTLVEALVALALLGLLAAGAAGLLPIMNRLSTAAAAAQAETLMLARSHDFLRAVISQARPISVLGSEAAATTTPFLMTTDHLRLLAPLPAGLAPGGLTMLDFKVAADGEGGAKLTMTATPLRRDSATAQATLIRNAHDIRWDYYDPASASWLAEWTDRDRLPTLLRLRVQGTVMGDWPDLVVRPVLEQSPLCVYDTIANRCR